MQLKGLQVSEVRSHPCLGKVDVFDLNTDPTALAGVAEFVVGILHDIDQCIEVSSAQVLSNTSW